MNVYFGFFIVILGFFIVMLVLAIAVYFWIKSKGKTAVQGDVANALNRAEEAAKNVIDKLKPKYY